MSSEPMPSIGTGDNPFKGIFDGDGHAIVGMVAEEGYMFSYLFGTLQNLALIDFSVCEGVNTVYPLACNVGGKLGDDKYYGHVKNCYVTGDIKIVTQNMNSTGNTVVQIAGLCSGVYQGCSIENCYFKGSFDVDCPNSTDNVSGCYFSFGGCVSAVYGTMNNCYASYTLDVFINQNDNKKHKTTKKQALDEKISVNSLY